MFIFYNPNPDGNLVGDCVIRAIAKVTGQSWEDAFLGVVNAGYFLKDMPSSNYVWAAYLKRMGFEKKIIPDTCPDCYTVRQFCEDHQYGTYLLGTGTHVVAVVDGDYYDTWDSGDEVPIYYFQRRDER